MATRGWASDQHRDHGVGEFVGLGVVSRRLTQVAATLSKTASLIDNIRPVIWELQVPSVAAKSLTQFQN